MTNTEALEQQRKRFTSDSKKAVKNFIAYQMRSKMLILTKSQCHGVCKGDTDRYLVELEFPKCVVSFQGQTHVKSMSEEDLRYLVATNFKSWKNYVMTKHFRLELNIGNEEPLPKILEDRRGEDDELVSEADPRDLYPATEEEKQKIEVTRGRLSAWFPI